MPKTKASFVRSRYILGLSIIGFLMLTFFSVVQFSLAQQEGVSAVINMSGRQRMLSQRTVMLVEEYINTRSPMVHELAVESIDLFEFSHQTLLNGNKDVGVKKINTPALQELYFGEEKQLDKRVSQQIVLLRQLLTELEAPQQKELLKRVLAEAHEPLLRDLNQAVTYYQEYSDGSLEKLKWLELGILLAMMSALILEVLYIFRPMERQIIQNQAEIELQKEELEVAYLQAKKSEELKSQFLDNINHEYRTPLNAIIGFSQTLQDLPDIQPAYKNFAGLIYKAGQDLMFLMENILQFSKLQNNQRTLKKADPIMLNALVYDLRAKYKDLAAEKGLELDIAINEELETPRLTNALLLRQILVNLLDNAVKFTNEGKVSFVMQGGSNSKDIQFLVTDTGAGIPPDQKKNLFQEFKQGDGTMRRQHGGLGLGLSLVSRIVSVLDGTVDCTDNAPQGTIVTVTLPMPKAE